MKKLIAILALLAALATVAASAETVDCFYEANAGHPACQK
jgi:hypothetical protein